MKRQAGWQQANKIADDAFAIGGDAIAALSALPFGTARTIAFVTGYGPLVIDKVANPHDALALAFIAGEPIEASGNVSVRGHAAGSAWMKSVSRLPFKRDQCRTA